MLKLDDSVWVKNTAEVRAIRPCDPSVLRPGEPGCLVLIADEWVRVKQNAAFLGALIERTEADDNAKADEIFTRTMAKYCIPTPEENVE